MRPVCLSLFFLVVLGSACRKPKEELTPQQQAIYCLETYYQNLISGDYAHCVQSISGYSSMLPEQRAQLEVALCQYCNEQKQKHGGIVDARSVDVVLQDNRAEAYVELVFADSLSERIVVPMVLEEKTWCLE